MSNEMDATEQEFNDADGSRWGWDGYHTEDAARFARHFRGQRDEVRILLIAAEAEVTRLKAALEKWNDLYPDLAQLLNGWTQDGSWSEWDNEVKLRVIATAADSRAALSGRDTVK